MKFNKKEPLRLSRRAEKLAREYSSRNNVSAEEFVEEAIAEKVEYEELRSESEEGVIRDADFFGPEDREYYYEERDDFKKRH